MDTQLEGKIYANYRASLRSLKSKPGSRNTRTAALKQEARVVTSERYQVPISQVKQIVREKDVANGVTHEHDVNYLKELAFIAEANVLIAAHGDNPACPQCGEIPAGEHDVVRVRVNPFESEIHGNLTPMLSCFGCYLNVKADI